MGRHIRIPSSRRCRRPFGTREIGTISVIRCPILVLRRFGHFFQASTEPLTDVERTHRCAGQIRGIYSSDFGELHPLRGSGDGLSSASRGFDSSRQRCASLPHILAVELTGDSDYFAPTFKLVVEHVYKIFFSKDLRRRYAKAALEILLNLAKKMASPFVDAAWIDDLLKRAAWKKIGDEAFIVLLGLSALRKTDEVATESDTTVGHDSDHIGADGADPRGVVTQGNQAPECALLDQVFRIVDSCSAQEDGWEDDAVYGGLIAIKDLPGLRLCDPKEEFIRTLSRVMEKRETEGEIKKDRPFRIRKAAYDVVVAVRDRWLKSPGLRETLEAVDLPRKLHSVVIETLRSDHQRSFLEMIEILSEDKDWHPYLRKAMDIWLPLHHEGPHHALLTLRKVGELRLLEHDDYNVNKSLEKVVEEEWAAVPGRHTTDLTADRLGPLAEVTEKFKRLSFFSEIDRRAVLAVVEQVVPCLERRRDEGYGGPDDEVRRIIEDLLKVLREPVQTSGRRPAFW